MKTNARSATSKMAPQAPKAVAPRPVASRPQHVPSDSDLSHITSSEPEHDHSMAEEDRDDGDCDGVDDHQEYSGLGELPEAQLEMLMAQEVRLSRFARALGISRGDRALLSNNLALKISSAWTTRTSKLSRFDAIDWFPANVRPTSCAHQPRNLKERP